MSSSIIDSTSFELVSLHPADLAPSFFYSFTVPANTVIRPVSASFTLTTDANVADRRVTIYGGPHAAYWSMSLADTVQPASTTITYHFTIDQATPFYSAALGLAQYPLQPELYLYPSEYFCIFKYNTQVGDVLSNIYWAYKRWILQ